MTVLQSWVTDLSLKNQTLLLSAIRGPDGVGKSNKVKEVLKYYRFCVLKQADTLSGFMKSRPPTKKQLNRFVKDVEELPLHYVMHTYRAFAIAGLRSKFWETLYQRLAKRLHLNPQTREQILESV